MSIKSVLLAAAIAATATVPATAQYGGRMLSADLRGNAEVPGPGKLDASGSATVRINPGQNRLCYTLSSMRIPRATIAHIHSGRAGVAGPPVLTLRAPSNGRIAECVPVARTLARAMLTNPRAFYVNIHSEAFPTGAVRGQLRR